MAIVGNCTVETCQAPAGGACVEGFSDLSKCPNFTAAPPESESATAIDGAAASKDGKESTPSTSTEDAHITLPSGDALTASDAHRFASQAPTTLVMLVGMVDSGKTTVLAEIYESFRRGLFANHLFAGTQTIMGFERVCHYARAVSGGDKEDTFRTVKGIGNNLLHLDLVDRKTRERKRLLLSDLSGEHFYDGTQSNNQLREIPYLRRADHFVLFADADKLRDPATRQSLLSQMLVLLRGCSEASLVDRACRLTVVVSRHDLLQPEESVDESIKIFIDSLREKIVSRAEALVDCKPTFIELAARPEDRTTNPYGLEDLLAIWLSPAEHQEPCIPEADARVRSALRQIDTMAFKGPANE